jgi:hypothetical protein
VATAKILAVKACTSIQVARLPCQPSRLVGLLASFSAHYQHLFFEGDFLPTNMPRVIHLFLDIYGMNAWKALENF